MTPTELRGYKDEARGDYSPPADPELRAEYDLVRTLWREHLAYNPGTAGVRFTKRKGRRSGIDSITALVQRDRWE